MDKLAAKYEFFISYRNTNNRMQTEDSIIEKKFSSLDSIVKYVKNALENVESLEPRISYM